MVSKVRIGYKFKKAMSMLFQSIQSVLVIILIIALGYVLQQRRWFGEEFPKNISRLITDIALPASIFSSVLKYLSRSELLSLGSSLIYPMGGVAIAYIVAIVLAKVLKVAPDVGVHLSIPLPMQIQYSSACLSTLPSLERIACPIFLFTMLPIRCRLGL